MKHMRSTWLLLAACGVILLIFLLYPVSLQRKLAAIPYGLDPQRPSHTYLFDGRPMPLEARKTGMFGGFLLSLLYMLGRGRVRAAFFPPRRIVVVLVAFMALMAADGLNATFYDLHWPHAYAPGLRLRLATGLLAGLTMAALVLPALNGSLWRDISDVRSLAGGRELAQALAALALLFILVDARHGILYYPLSLFTVAGLLAELVMLNMVFVLALTRRAGLIASAVDVVPIALAGLLASAGELAVMSIIRFLTLGSL